MPIFANLSAIIFFDCVAGRLAVRASLDLSSVLPLLEAPRANENFLEEDI